MSALIPGWLLSWSWETDVTSLLWLSVTDLDSCEFGRNLLTRRPMNPNRSSSALLLALLLAGAARGESVLGRASTHFMIVKIDEKADEKVVETVKQEEGKGRKWKIKKVAIVRVINQRGNNPLNPVEPVNNRNGRIVTPARGRVVTPVVPAAPTPTTWGSKFATYQSGGMSLEVSLVFDPTANTYNVLSQANSPDLRVIALGLDTGTATTAAVIRNPAGNVWAFVAGGSRIDFPFNTSTKTFRARHKSTGKVYQIRFTPSFGAGGGVRVNGITEM